MSVTLIFDNGLWFLELLPEPSGEAFELEVTEDEATQLRDFGIVVWM